MSVGSIPGAPTQIYPSNQIPPEAPYNQEDEGEQQGDTTSV